MLYTMLIVWLGGDFTNCSVTSTRDVDDDDDALIKNVHVLDPTVRLLRHGVNPTSYRPSTRAT